MNVPQIKLTMLGATGSGKTTLMHSLYAMLAQGIHSYHLYTDDPDDHLDLMGAWEALCENGDLPPGNANVPVPYQMTFNHGLRTLLHLDFVDFRGGAGTLSAKKNADEDITQLRERLSDTDSLYLVLDGTHVGRWIAEGCEGPSVGDPMAIGRLTPRVLELFKARHVQGRSTPSLVVVITKCDVLSEISGIPRQEAMQLMLKNMNKLVPFAYYPGITAMICPVQIGQFGRNPGTNVDPTKVQPIYVHKPLIFSLLYYLTEHAENLHDELGRIGTTLTTARREAQALQSRLGAIRRPRRIREKHAEIGTWDDRYTQLKGEISTTEQRAEMLMRELDGLPIIKDGEQQ